MKTNFKKVYPNTLIEVRMLKKLPNSKWVAGARTDADVDIFIEKQPVNDNVIIEFFMNDVLLTYSISAADLAELIHYAIIKKLVRVTKE